MFLYHYQSKNSDTVSGRSRVERHDHTEYDGVGSVPDVGSGVRTREYLCTTHLKCVPLDHSGIPTYLCLEKLLSCFFYQR